MILPNIFWQKKTTFFIIFMLLISSYSSFFPHYNADTTSFNEGMNNDDGVYYTSQFTDVENYFGGCVKSSHGNKLTLNPEGSQFNNYNFSDWHPESHHSMYSGDLFWFTSLWPLSIVMNYFEDKVEEENYYWATSINDGITYPYEYKVTPTSYQQIHHFRFKITQDISSSSLYNITWFGKADNYKSVSLYIWDPIYNALGLWDKLDTVTSNQTSIELEYANTSLTLNDDNYLDICVVVVPLLGEKCSIQTDYINVKMEGSGYATEGAARFHPIIPNNISRWERFSWRGYEKPLTSIEFQFFHEENNSFSLISDTYIDDNSDGISVKNVDLSNLPIETNLTINVSFETSDLSVAPDLYDWGVSWQVSNESWADKFSSDLRIDEGTMQNIRINGGNANLITTVYDWPMFGQNSENTRVSPGLGPGATHNSLCWESKEEVGGDQKNPIINDGVLYIANGLSSRIYAYDPQYDISYLPNSYTDYSDVLGYDIKNSPVATNKNTIVVATGSSTDGGGIDNKVIALNANDLQIQEWSFSFGSVDPEDDFICYEASPVLYENKIFLTSWNGDSSLLTEVFDFLNFTKGNNKIICLTDEGSYVWSQDLPSGSFASPAVDGNTVVVGCEKFNGDSLHSFTLDGTKLWSENVGPIGHASPVINDNTVYVVSRKVGQALVTTLTQVVAVDLTEGNIKWNITIGDLIPESYANTAFTSPVVVNGFVYVTSPDGMLYKLDKEDGSVVKSKKIYNKGVSTNIIRSSPAYADGLLYIGTADGYLKTFNAVTLEEVWKKKTNPVNPVFSSPIIVDGFVYYVDESGALYCRGKQQISDDEQITGELVSIPIKLPNNYYWGKFFVTDDTNEGYIKYNILDEHYNLLIEDIENNKKLSNETLNDEDTIRLKAVFHANAKETVTLDSWMITFSEDEPEPVGETIFQDFEKNLSDPPVFSVDVQNDVDGLINTSARFKLEYSNESMGTFETNWFSANFSGENETTDKETITVNMSYINFTDEIDVYHRIRFSINNTLGESTYSSWYTIEGKPDDHPPRFYNDSFTPDPPYISTLTPTCTIQVKDVGNNANITGINVDSAEYTIEYKQNSSTKMHTEKASCNGSNGTISKVTLTADISLSSVHDNISSLQAIQFTIRDMKGNSNQSEWFDLFYDSFSPQSSITNNEDIPPSSNASFIIITASAQDEEKSGEYASGIKEVLLKYRMNGETEWNTFEKTCTTNNCSWDFSLKENEDGGEYELCTIAIDNASNEEKTPSIGEVFLTYDPFKPTVTFPDETIEITDGGKLPVINQVTFTDDYKLNRVYYRLGSDGTKNWTLITTTDSKSITPEWMVTETQWNAMKEDKISNVFFKAVDALGNKFITSSSQNALKILKNIEDSSNYSIDVKDFQSWQFDNTYMIRVNTQNTTDIDSMKLWYRFAGENKSTSANWTQYETLINSTPFEWDFIPDEGDGYYQFYVEVTTKAGDTVNTSIETVHISLFPLIELITVLVITIILFAVSGLVIKKYRQSNKKKII